MKKIIKKPYFFPLFIFFVGLSVFTSVAISKVNFNLAGQNEDKKEKGESDPELFLGSEEGERIKGAEEEAEMSPSPTVTKSPTISKKPTNTPTNAPTNTPTQTPTESPTPTQSPQETPTVTPTPSPTESPTPTPTEVPTPI